MKKYWTNVSGSLKFDPEALHEFLKECGFGILKAGDLDGSLLIKVEGRIVKTVTSKEIRDFCWRYIGETYVFQDPEERTQVKNVFYREKSLFSYDNLLLMPVIEIKEILDTQDTSYLFFKNIVLKITSKGLEKVKYAEIQGHVFEKDIIDFELRTDDFEDHYGNFLRFIKDISYHDNDLVEDNNFESIISILGYVLHRYKDPSNAKAIVFMDPYRGEGANGGTGKSLLTKAFEKIRPSVYEDGKFFHTKERFALSQLNYNSRVLVIDDIPENFDFSKLFPLITEKAVVEKKYQNKYTIHFERSPKIVITTNYILKGLDESSRRRKIEFVFSDYYNSQFTPETNFGNLFFIDWDQTEWESFYLLMAYAIQTYLKNGFVEQKYNTNERALKMEAHPKFIEFNNEQIKVGVKYNKKDIFDQFYNQNPGVGNVEMTTFRKWLKLYADAYGYKFNESHSGNDNFFEYSLE